MAQIGSNPLPNTLTTTTSSTATAVTSTTTRSNTVVTNVASALGNSFAGTNVPAPDDALIKSLVVPAKATSLAGQEEEVTGAFVIDFTALQKVDQSQQPNLMARLQAEVQRRTSEWDAANASDSSDSSGSSSTIGHPGNSTSANTTTVNNAANANAAPNPTGPNAPGGAHTALGQKLGPYKGAFGAVMGALVGGAIVGAAHGAAAGITTAATTAVGTLGNWTLEERNVTYAHGSVHFNWFQEDVDLPGQASSPDEPNPALISALNQQWADPNRTAVFPAEGVSLDGVRYVERIAYPAGGDPVADPREDSDATRDFYKVNYEAIVDPGGIVVSGNKTIFRYVRPVVESLVNQTVNAFTQNPALWAAIEVPGAIVVGAMAIGGYYLAQKRL